MNYRHAYHAGNFADILKHWILTLILQKLSQKPNPFFVLDTHAGIGLYPFSAPEAQKTLEYETGIMQLLQQQSFDPAFAPYMEIVHKFAKHDIYPGSPAIIQEFMREHDRAVFSELHSQDYVQLQENFANDRRIKVFQRNGYDNLKALLPPSERRGLVLIDPAFEVSNEWDLMLNGVQEALKRFAHGIYMLWYPIKDRKLVARFYKNLQQLQMSVICVELHLNQNIVSQLTSCGLIIINPPWQLPETIQAGMPKLCQYMNFNHAQFKIANL